MHIARMTRTHLGILIALVAACVPPVQTIAYSPQPARITNPPEELKALILANTVQGCLTEPTYSQAMLVVKFMCTGTPGNTVLRFDRIAKIELQQQGPWFRVRVTHRSGVDDFVWDSKSLDDAQRINDAIVALSRGKVTRP